MIYLASPYSHPDAAVREARFRAACQATAGLLKAGHHVLCPIAHSHPLVAYGLPTDWDFWQQVDHEYLRHCDEMVVLMLDGWRESKGVLAEIGIAEELGKPVRYMDPPAVPTVAPVIKQCAKQ